jgi:hypothetical protein
MTKHIRSIASHAHCFRTALRTCMLSITQPLNHYDFTEDQKKHKTLVHSGENSCIAFSMCSLVLRLPLHISFKTGERGTPPTIHTPVYPHHPPSPHPLYTQTLSWHTHICIHACMRTISCTPSLSTYILHLAQVTIPTTFPTNLLLPSSLHPRRIVLPTRTLPVWHALGFDGCRIRAVGTGVWLGGRESNLIGWIWGDC